MDNKGGKKAESHRIWRVTNSRFQHQKKIIFHFYCKVFSVCFGCKKKKLLVQYMKVNYIHVEFLKKCFHTSQFNCYEKCETPQNPRLTWKKEIYVGALSSAFAAGKVLRIWFTSTRTPGRRSEPTPATRRTWARTDTLHTPEVSGRQPAADQHRQRSNKKNKTEHEIWLVLFSVLTVNKREWKDQTNDVFVHRSVLQH